MAGGEDSEIAIADPMIISRTEVLELFDRVLRRELPTGEAYLFAVDVVESTRDGTARLEDPSMLPALEELAGLTAVTYDIVDEIRRRLRRPHEEGTA
ncbi:hypothetical protein L6R52_35415 [Myxococcota bacterium]|nr:hypothetical protein [Myxococcota bacterium]